MILLLELYAEMILKINLKAFYPTTWKEKRTKKGDCGCICVRSSQRGVSGNKRWMAWRAVKKEDLSN